MLWPLYVTNLCFVVAHANDEKDSGCSQDVKVRGPALEKGVSVPDPDDDNKGSMGPPPPPGEMKGAEDSSESDDDERDDEDDVRYYHHCFIYCFLIYQILFFTLPVIIFIISS